MTPLTERNHTASLGSGPGLDVTSLDRFERISRLAQRIFFMPVASLFVTDEERTEAFVPGGAGAPDRVPVGSAQWSELIASPDVVVVPDTLRDTRFAADPLSTCLRCLVCYPLKTMHGERLGTLVLGDRVPRTLGADDLACLDDLANTVAAELGMARHATTDALTMLLNRCGFMRIGELALRLCRRHGGEVSLLYFDLDGFKQINDEHGHHAGDQALVQFAALLRQSARSSDLVARLGGDEFVILAHSSGLNTPEPLVMRVRRAVDSHNRQSGKPYKIQFSVGCTTRDVGSRTRLATLLTDADRRMYSQKAAGKTVDTPRRV
jgi:diguanylate cyclase (GGDEF)-like protein